MHDFRHGILIFLVAFSWRIFHTAGMAYWWYWTADWAGSLWAFLFSGTWFRDGA